MRIQKLRYDPGALADFFSEGLQSLGAICERTWHDRLQVLAEGEAARLWSATGAFTEIELHFTEPGDSRPKEAAFEIFPGCPLAFRLAEALWGGELALECAVIRFPEHLKAPSLESARRVWQGQFSSTTQWEQLAPFQPGWSFSLIALVRCEIQAIDQRWSLHRLALSLPDGAADEHLASNLAFAETHSTAPGLPWPVLDLQKCSNWLGHALRGELENDLKAVQQRQEAYLRRELRRIDNYFEQYQRELASRSRSGKEAALKLNERLAATQAEHESRRQDQLRRHEIRIIPHVDSLMLLAEPCWSSQIRATAGRRTSVVEGLYVPRSRVWKAVNEIAA